MIEQQVNEGINSEDDSKKSPKTSRSSSFQELPELEEIENQPFSFSLSDSEVDSDGRSAILSRPQSRLPHHESPDNTSIEYDLSGHSTGDSTSGSTSDSTSGFTSDSSRRSSPKIPDPILIDHEYEFSLDEPLSPTEWKRRRTEQILKHIQFIIPPSQFQDQ